MQLLTGLLGSVNPPSVLGYVCLAFIPSPEVVISVEESGDGDDLSIYDRFLKRKLESEKRRKQREEEEMLAVMLVLMS